MINYNLHHRWYFKLHKFKWELNTWNESLRTYRLQWLCYKCTTTDIWPLVIQWN